MNLRSPLFLAAISVLMLDFATARADTLTYTFTMDTSSLAGQQGYIDLQFTGGDAVSGGGFTAYNSTGTASVSEFQTDGSLAQSDPYGNGGSYGDVSGNLSSVVSFSLLGDGATNEYDQLLTFGNQLSFSVALAGQAVTTPICPVNQTGAICSGAGFLVDFYDPTASYFLFTSDPDGDQGTDWVTGGININVDTTTTTYTNPGPGGGPSDLTIKEAAVSPVPEPASVFLLGTGLGVFLGFGRRALQVS